MKNPPRWSSETFLRRACDQMDAELDWDSLDCGCLHRTVSRARTLSNADVIVGVISDPTMLAEALKHAEDERQSQSRHARWRGLAAGRLPVETPFWIYVPSDLELLEEIPATVVIKRVSSS